MSFVPSHLHSKLNSIAFPCDLYVSKSVTVPARPYGLAVRLDKVVQHNQKIIVITDKVSFNIPTNYFTLRHFFKETAFAFSFVEHELVQ